MTSPISRLGATFCPLPNVAAETGSIQTLLPQALLLSQDRATKLAARQLRNPSILHFATHGFFLPDPPEKKPNAKVIQNPLSRSALVLANFNQRRSCGDDSNCNGLLTAQDVTTIDLRGTKLVFLSACETGLGKITNGEGVYGLRRAFTLTGGGESSHEPVVGQRPNHQRVGRELLQKSQSKSRSQSVA